MVEKLYSRFGGVLNGGVKLRSSPMNLAGTLLLTLPPSKFGLLLVKFMLTRPPNEVLNRLTFEERMAKEPPTTVVDMELSPEDRQRIYMEEKNQLSDRGTLEIRFIWAGSTSIVPRAELESKIREDVDGDTDLHPCHSGIMAAHLRSCDPLEVSVKGHLVCTCGKSLALFSGDSDGLHLTWE